MNVTDVPPASGRPDPQPAGGSLRATFVLLAVAIVWIAALLQRGLALGWDEIEYFRATRWVAEGRVPFRDFWEHHTPLQWLMFAPVAWFANGAGAGAVVLLRWAQVPLWIAIFALLLRIARHEEIDAIARWTALACLLASSSFIRKAIEYRVDVPGNLGYIAAVALIAFGASAKRWAGFGALMSLAVLANMRLVPLVIITAALALFWRADERTWRWNPRALWMSAGVVATATIFLGYVFATRSMPQFLDGIVRYNVGSGRQALQVETFLVTLLAPVWLRDLAGIAFWLLGLAGVVLVLRRVRTPGPLQFVAVLFLASMLTVWMLEVHYEYHFQNAYLLLLPLAAVALGRMQRPRLATAVVALALALNAMLTVPSFGVAMQYQHDVMTTVDRMTAPDERVFDGVGYALRREPAYRYWFLPTGLRFMAAQKLVEPYDAPQIAAEPPAALIFNLRMLRWFEIFPQLGRYAVSHYVPLYRDLWIPGLTATIDPRPRRIAWIAPRAGDYEVWTSDVLAKHPWFSRPLEYAMIGGTGAPLYTIPLHELPPLERASLQWRVDGRKVEGRTLRLRKGARVELLASAPVRAGLLLVPRGVSRLCMAPAVGMEF
jgi:hypothetical protein